MKFKKEFRYHLKKDVREDLENLNRMISCLIYYDNDGFEFIPHFSILPVLFKVYSHLLWNRTFESWFKKVYK